MTDTPPDAHPTIAYAFMHAGAAMPVRFAPKRGARPPVHHPAGVFVCPLVEQGWWKKAVAFGA